jgi:hypothetical protein
MTISGTYELLQFQIADELGDRQDLLAPLGDSNLTMSPIQNAIQSAIAYWEREPFYFNELYDQAFLTTVALQEFYTAADSAEIATIPYIIKLRALVNNQRYYLRPRTWQFLEETSVNDKVVAPIPIAYAYFANTLRIYPIPAGNIPLTVSGTQRFAALSAPNDSNVWTTDAFDLIRCQAKLIIANEVLYDDDMARRMKLALYGDPKAPFTMQQTRGYVGQLKRETSQRANARIRPTVF